MNSPTYSPINNTEDCVLCSSNIFNYPEDISICDTRYVPCKQQMMTIAFVSGVGSGGGGMAITLKTSLHCAHYSLLSQLNTICSKQRNQIKKIQSHLLPSIKDSLTPIKNCFI
jgi:hypothetical protein